MGDPDRKIFPFQLLEMDNLPWVGSNIYSLMYISFWMSTKNLLICIEIGDFIFGNKVLRCNIDIRIVSPGNKLILDGFHI